MSHSSGPEQFHGGDVSVALRWPDAPKPTVDLSTGINPFSYPFDPPPDLLWRRLPQAEAEGQLRRILADYLGLATKDTLVLAPGSQILINQLPFLFARGEVSIMGPTYGEHAACWSRAGHRVVEVEWGRFRLGDRSDAGLDARLDDRLDGRLDESGVLVVTNPNNPDGRQFDRSALIEMAQAKKRSGGFLVLDEAFADMTPSLSVADLVEELPVIVLRSFGKFFGLAGMRLGAMAASPGLCFRMRERLGPWSVSGPTLEIASRAYSDTQWIRSMRARLKREASRLDRLLGRFGLDPLGGTDLFRLVEHGRAEVIYEGLGARGILVRAFDHHPNWLRLGLPSDEAVAERLARALEEVMNDV